MITEEDAIPQRVEGELKIPETAENSELMMDETVILQNMEGEFMAPGEGVGISNSMNMDHRLERLVKGTGPGVESLVNSGRVHCLTKPNVMEGKK